MNKENLTIVVTGAAGFIGAALCKKLISQRIKVIGIDDRGKVKLSMKAVQQQQ